ncbi:S41 family peptidase [Hyphococcus flavus]|uniref:S41 family peptidase n=1 Tax=Hyphococcus flavus TaxID=1866326 RepID=A0AAE9ZIN2_9PROT|nr:S41 family peptidase [Hyphococcus flavus]WDI31701.1 S41 family peptidase [Hyphococcus flavus]
MLRVLLGVVAAITFFSQATAQHNITAEEARATLMDLAGKLEAGYMDPDIGAAYAAMLRENLGAGAYENLADAKEFAAAVTEDIQAVNSDAHLTLNFAPPREGDAPGAPPPPPSMDAYGETKWINDDVAYSEWLIFLGMPDALDHARKIMTEYQGAKALIIDLRKLPGGGLAELDILASYIFEAPTHLVTMNIREGMGGGMASMFDGLPSMKRQPTTDGIMSWQHWTLSSDDKLGWDDTPVYILTSGKTASAGEHFTLAFKTTGRGTVVGETTAGAGHFGGPARIGKRFTAFIPVGETIDPKTGQGWEGAGIEPDVKIAADDALEKALELIATPL